jgi:hypothetical protein
MLCKTDARQIDHIDHDIYNNRRSNLRPASHSDNFGNQRKRQTYAGRQTTSKYKGVHKIRDKNRWIAQVTYKGEVKFRGAFSNEVEAAKAYNREALKVFGEFANLNIIEEE